MWAAIRLIRATWVFAWIFASYMLQIGLVRGLGRERFRRRWQTVHRRNARRMYRGFVRLRGVYIKLGQILSIMGSFLPRAYGEELEGLQDEVPAQPYEKIARSFQRAFGKSPTEAFASFSRKPIAAASLGQVHEARSHDGERLAVKLLYPNIATIIKIDLRVLGWALRVYRMFVPVKQLERVHEQLEDLLARETDLSHEAHCLERMAANLVDDPDVIFPAVHHAYTCQTVLTMSFMEGVKITRIEALNELALEPQAVATKLVQIFYRQIFIDRFFHADPHPGNFFVQRSPDGRPRIVMLDLGSASEVKDNLADGMLQVLSGLMSRNDDLLIRGIETMGFVAADGDRALLERTVRKYFEKLLNLNIRDVSQVGKLGADVAGRLAATEARRAELRELMKSVEYPLGWFYVERAVIIMFGLSMQLAPNLDTLTVGFPYVMKFMAERQAALALAPPAEPAASSQKSSPPSLAGA
jgi:predicted unusual protein kinase regulating ubiquinone biosynthesis (AarF/ABC1/UbiB family)